LAKNGSVCNTIKLLKVKFSKGEKLLGKEFADDVLNIKNSGGGFKKNISTGSSSNMKKKLAMDTARELAGEAEEFSKIYNLDVTLIPTNKPVVRKDLSDKISVIEIDDRIDVRRIVVKNLKKKHRETRQKGENKVYGKGRKEEKKGGKMKKGKCLMKGIKEGHS